jgi:hypothetical protein
VVIDLGFYCLNGYLNPGGFFNQKQEEAIQVRLILGSQRVALAKEHYCAASDCQQKLFGLFVFGVIFHAFLSRCAI